MTADKYQQQLDTCTYSFSFLNLLYRQQMALDRAPPKECLEACSLGSPCQGLPTALPTPCATGRHRHPLSCPLLLDKPPLLLLFFSFLKNSLTLFPRGRHRQKAARVLGSQGYTYQQQQLRMGIGSWFPSTPCCMYGHGGKHNHMIAQ